MREGSDEQEGRAWLAMMEQAQKIELSEEDYDTFVAALDKSPSPKVFRGIQSLFQRKLPWND
ncbi:hypothetical protein OAA_18455 [Vibrio cyclitrophicus 1F175]|uniref:type II toxin -antitoxin system TacA 1-like antitoxin n=1 Tax=Vibrio cyclitrophicus TaxID=47951 RepID=UPI00035F1527|nr:DUF1778 domain-containing protein [Vibrio cyclitrophicus]OEF62545.1 hypothetical protein OAA_18455 [Vibrio cyclitrophicus 1F175]